MRTKLFLILGFLLSISGFLIWGCGGSREAINPVSSVDNGPIVKRLNAFAKVLATGDMTSAQSYFSTAVRANSSGQLQSLTICDFGKKIGTNSDNTFYTFEIAPDGIVQPSTVDATVKAYFTMCNSTRIELIFQMIKQFDEWYIDDIKVNIAVGVSFPLATFFPIQSGNFWKFQTNDLRVGEARDITISVSSASQIIDGKNVLYLECSSVAKTSSSAAVKASMLNPGGITRLTWGFSNAGGLWNYGVVSESSYVFNNGKPMKILDENFKAGDIATWTVSEKFGDVSYSKQIVIQVMPPALVNSVYGSVKAIPLRFIWRYLNGISPSGLLSGAEEWYLRENFGLIAFREFDPDSGQTWSNSVCVGVKVKGVVQNQVSMVLMKTFLPDGVVGQSYSTTLTVFGGTPPFSFLVASGSLPAGITVLKSGNLTGTPSVGGIYSFAVKALDSSGLFDTSDFTLSIAPFTISSVFAPTAFVNEAWNVKMTTQGGIPPISWQIASGSLPTGLKFVPPDSISGMISATGTFEFTLKATDANNQEAYKKYSVQIIKGLTITAEIPSSVIINTTMTGKYSALGGLSPYSFSLQEGFLPKGVALSSDGILSGKPTEIGSFTYIVKVLDSVGKSTQIVSTLKVEAGIENSLIISTSSIPSWTNAFATYTATLSASGGLGELKWEILSGNIPPGLTFNTGGTLTGNPTSVGSYSFIIKVTDSMGKSSTAEIKLNVVSDLIVSSSIATSMEANSSFSGLFGASGGVPPYSFLIISGNLPVGLSMESDGKISGTPTTAGTYAFSVRVTDSKGLTAEKSSSIQIVSPSVLAPIPTFTIVLSSVSSTAYTEATYTANLQSQNGVAPISWMISSGTLPTGISLSGNRLSGIPQNSGTYFFDLTASDSIGKLASATFSIQVQNLTPLLLTGKVAILSNTPANPTNLNSAMITVGGADVVKYSYSIDDGAWSAECRFRLS
ncbi:MAG: putative Ig domain-containing protein [Candidatus Riflebacteria bacterium]|nr:putative Ig domain-containing protein [Candidatus Riflebacteria bacterium]